MAHPFRSQLQAIEAANASSMSADRATAHEQLFGRRSLPFLLANSALCVASGAGAQTILPQGGQVAAGQASITMAGQTTTITQSSQRAIVNWENFSVSQGGQVNIVQTGADAAMLNRVTGATTTEIAGALNATGRVYLVNPNGVVITPTGTVTAGGGFVASSLNIADDDFLADRLNFRGSGASAAVINRGAISVGNGGFAALLGGRVANTGTISVPLGRIGLGAAETATLDLNGDGFLQVAVPGAPDGNRPLIEAGGVIAGSRVELRAASVVGAIRDAVNVPGTMVVRGARQEGGAVILDGGGGTIGIAGMIDASSASDKGGRITVEGARITLGSDSRLLATGATGGGTVLVGGDVQGGPGLAQASHVSMAAGALIDVSATQDGGGGTAVLWSDITNSSSRTDFSGTIWARGTGRGNGGFVETSAYFVDSSGGFVNAGADHGNGGLWLIDPADSVITQTVADSYAATLNTGTSVLNDVVGSITWDSGVTLNKTAGGNATLTLRTAGAGGTGLSPINLDGATINSTAGALNLVLWTRYNGVASQGTISVTGSTINTNGGQLWLGGGGTGMGSLWNGLAVGGSFAAAWGAGQQGVLIHNSSLTTGAGNISISGYSSSTTTNNGINQFGVMIDGGTSLFTTTGGISIMGGVDGLFRNGAGVWIGDANQGGSIAISSGSGAINIMGIGVDQAGSDSGWRHGLMIYRWSTTDATTIRSTSGAINLTGTANFSANDYTTGDSSGLQLQVIAPGGGIGVTSTSGAITLRGTNTLEANATANNGLRLMAPDAANALRIGYDGITAYSGAITLNANSIQQRYVNAGSGSISMQTTGQIIVQPVDTSFTYLRADASPLTFDNDWNFGSSASGLTIGKSGNSYDLTLSSALATAGPINILAGNLALNAGLGASGSTIALNAIGTGGISGSAAGTIGNFSTLTLNATNASASGILAGVISGSGNVTKSGAGVLGLSGVNSYNGATTVSGGTLRAGSTSAFGINSITSVASGATLDLASFSNSIGSLAGAGIVTNSGASVATLTSGSRNSSTIFSGIMRNGAATLGFTKVGTGMQGLTGVNTYTGTTNVNGGILSLGVQSALSIGTSVAINTGGTMRLDAHNIWGSANTGTTSPAISINAGGTLASNNNFNQIVNLTLNGGTLLANGGASSAWQAFGLAGTVTVTANSVIQAGSAGNGRTNIQLGYRNGNTTTFDIANGRTLTVTNVLTNNGDFGMTNLTVTGGGTLALSGANSFTGALTITNGTVAMGNVDSLGAVNNIVSIASGSTLNITNTSGVNTPYQHVWTGAGTINFSNTDTVQSNYITGNGVGFTGNIVTSGAGKVGFGAVDFSNAALSANADTSIIYNGTTVAFGSLTGTGLVRSQNLSSDLTTLVVGNRNLDTTFNGTLGETATDRALTFVKVGTGTLTLAGANTYTGTTTINAGRIDLTGSYNIGTSQTASIYIGAGASLTGSGIVTAGALAVSGGGSVALDGSNRISTVTGTGTVGAFALRNAQSLSLNSLVSSGPVTIEASGATSDITLLSGAAIASSAGGNAVTLAAGRNFHNLAGAGAITTPSGRWLVYSQSRAANSFGDLDSGNHAVWGTSYGAAIGAMGNRYVFTQSPTLTVSALNAAKAYGADGSAALATAYSISGYDPGVAGAYLADSFASALAGTPLMLSSGSNASVNAGSYAILPTLGSLQATSGYQLATGASATLSVMPVALLVTVNDVSKLYDGIGFTGGSARFSGFVNGDAASNLDGALSFGGSSQGATNVGSYGITAAGLTSGNYTVSYQSGTLSITPAALTLTFTANQAASVYGAALSGLSGTVSGSGFVNGEGLANLGGAAMWATNATPSANVGNYGIIGSGFISGNYAITAAQSVGNDSAYRVNPTALRVTVNDVNKDYDGIGFSGGSVRFSGFVNGDTASNLGGALSFGGSSKGAIEVGSYGISASGLTSDNYTVSYQPGALNIFALRASAVGMPWRYIPEGSAIIPSCARPIALSHQGQASSVISPPQTPWWANQSPNPGCGETSASAS